MKITLLRGRSFFTPGPKLGQVRINTINGKVFLSKKEKEEIIFYCREIYEKVFHKTGYFLGIVRFDLVPGVKSFRKTKGEYNWNMSIRGVYEVNTNSPECGAATAALHRSCPLLSNFQPCPAERIARVLNRELGGREIGFVIGGSLLKRDWGRNFIEALREKRLNVKEAKIEDASKYNCLWRFGDIREGEGNEFPDDFKGVLLEKQENSGNIIINTVPESPESDIGNKKHLPRESEQELLEKDRKDLVLKPFLGSSGNGIIFGDLETQESWEKALKEKLGSSYGLFQAQWLPRIEITEVEGGVAMDICATFMAMNEKLEYLYTICRIDSYSNYWDRRTINVAQGAGFVGTLIDC